MRVGVCSWSLRPDGPESLIGAVKRLGLESVQLALGPMIDCRPEWLESFGQIRDAGIEIASGMLSFPGEDYSTLETIRKTGGLRPDDAWTANLDRAAAAAGLAAREGIGLVSFHAGFLPPQRDRPDRQVMVERLGAVADVFKKEGVAIALETGQETAATLVEVLGELGRKKVGVNFDPANMVLYGMGDPVTALQQLVPHVRQVHVKDAQPAELPGTWGEEVPVGAGVVDWNAFFDVARDLDPAVRFVIEREAGADRDLDIARARDLVERHLAVDNGAST